MKRCVLASLFLLTLTALNTTGCDRGKPQNAGKEKDPPPAKNEDGWLFHEPNENYHIRLLVDATAKKATAKIFDGSAQELRPIATDTITLNFKGAKEQIVLKGEGDKGKKRAVFIGVHDRFGDKIDPEKVEMTAEIEGKNYNFMLDRHHD